MNAAMRPLPFEVLLDWILVEYRSNASIFGIPSAQFFLPESEPRCATELHGSHLATPFGPAAGPHTQLAQNIVSAWVCGGRFIELKTVQIMDELEIPRPCIDMADEGYNVEWSQELRLGESASEYAKAWALIHVLRRLLGLESKTRFGTIFNMSVGYDLAGILAPPMQAFIDRLEDASDELTEIREILERRRGLSGIDLPHRIVDSVTLSTMHGCPPDEIERIACYLLQERGLHTTVKLNPTLLGKERVLSILHERLGFAEIDIPDTVFDQDLAYARAVEMISSLRELAAARGVGFGVKLSNTLAMANHKEVLPGDEMYMSGRALFPVTVNLFARLVDQFDGDLDVSFSAGADALNAADLVASGALPITAASDLLKPGGYAKLRQYVEDLERAMADADARSLGAFASARRERLARLADDALAADRYTKRFFSHGLPKTSTPLELLDCIEAPCVDACAIRQDIPTYVGWIARGDDDRALATILARNPLPGVTSYVCTHLCQTKCTRNNNDEPVAIRKLKRFATERGMVALEPAVQTGHRVAVIGSGPSGLAAAFFLALSGIDVTILEAKDFPGGMPAIAPAFRLPREIVTADIDRIRGLGVKIETGASVDGPPERLLDDGFDGVYVACGFATDAGLEIDGIDARGVLGALELLDRVARGDAPNLGADVVVIGGGNTAMDAARTAKRLTGSPVTVVYRRTRAEMPAEAEEVRDLLDEGNRLLELVSPVRIVTADGAVRAVQCVRNELGPPDETGRRRPVPIAGTEFTLDATAVVLATGQRPDLGFLDGSQIEIRSKAGIVVEASTGRAAAAPIYAGGDVTRGPAIIVEACADGRRAAEAICAELGAPFRTVPTDEAEIDETGILSSKRARAEKSMQHRPVDRPADERAAFELVEGAFDEPDARAEAARCLQCSALCDKCVEVCPNRANVAILVRPIEATLPTLAMVGGTLSTRGEEPVAVRQARQIVHVDDLCNACGNCSTFCVHPGDPFRDKPRLFLRADGFEAEDENAFLLESDGLRRREGGREMTLRRASRGYRYGTEHVSVLLGPDGSVDEIEATAPFHGTLSLRPAIEMLVLFEGIASSAPYLIEATERLAGEVA